MNRSVLVVVLVAILFVPRAASAQWAVFDFSNLQQAITTFRQLQTQYQFLVEQAQRLPFDMAARYGVPSVPWPSHVPANAVTQPLLDALNRGDRSGAMYAATVATLDPLDAVLARIPAPFQPRVGTGYATIELADRIAATAIDHAGTLRTQGARVVDTIQHMEDDAVSGDPRLHTQAALLNKLNTASVLGLRIAAQTSQTLVGVAEQLLVTNKRQRDAEAKMMNAQLYHWQYGPEYSRDLVSRTAQALDTWRQP